MSNYWRNWAKKSALFVFPLPALVLYLKDQVKWILVFRPRVFFFFFFFGLSKSCLLHFLPPLSYLFLVNLSLIFPYHQWRNMGPSVMKAVEEKPMNCIGCYCLRQYIFAPGCHSRNHLMVLTPGWVESWSMMVQPTFLLDCHASLLMLTFQSLVQLSFNFR